MLRILIDPVACDAYGYCAELLPEAISRSTNGAIPSSTASRSRQSLSRSHGGQPETARAGP